MRTKCSGWLYPVSYCLPGLEKFPLFRVRAQEQVEEWERRDPINRFQTYLKNKGLLTDEAISSLEEDIKSEIQQAVKTAEQMMKELGDPMDMFLHALAEAPPTLEAQKKELAQDLAEGGQEVGNG